MKEIKPKKITEVRDIDRIPIFTALDLYKKEKEFDLEERERNKFLEDFE